MSLSLREARLSDLGEIVSISRDIYWRGDYLPAYYEAWMDPGSRRTNLNLMVILVIVSCLRFTRKRRLFCLRREIASSVLCPFSS